jgi:hypothetical protein
MRIPVRDFESGEAILEELLRNFGEGSERTSRFTFDLGASATLFGLLDVGVTAKNLIPIRFDGFEIGPQVRAGVSAGLGPLRLGVDLDLFESDLSDLAEGLRSRVMGGGAEFQIGGSALGLSVRGGLFDNIASSESSPVWTLGLGVRVAGFFLDANGQLAWSGVRIEEAGGARVPERLAGSLALGFDLRF